MDTKLPDTDTYCAYCGHSIADAAAAPQRFGERFCSEAHAEEFAAGVRSARMETAARAKNTEVAGGAKVNGTCALPPAGERGWSAHLKRAACWGAPLLLLLAIPLIWSGGWAATGGSLLGVLALLACPLGMYFMMRGMMSMQHRAGPAEAERSKEDRHA